MTDWQIFLMAAAGAGSATFHSRAAPQGEHGRGCLSGGRFLGGDREDVGDDPLRQPGLEPKAHVPGGEGDDVVQVPVAQGA